MSSHPSSDVRLYRPDLALGVDAFDLQADLMGMHGLSIAPAVEVSEAAGSYSIVPFKSLNRTENVVRNSDGSYNYTEGTFTYGSWTTKDYGLQERVDNRDAKLYRSWLDMELYAAARTRAGVIRAHTQRVYDLARSSVADTNVVGDADDRTTFDPVPIIDAAKLSVRDATGRIPNAMLIDYQLYLALRDNSAVRDRAWKTNAVDTRTYPQGMGGVELLRTVFDLEYLFVNGAVTDSANEAAAASISAMWPVGESLLWCHEPNTSPQLQPFMRTFHWGEDGSAIGSVFESWHDDGRRSEIIRHRMETDEKVLNASLAVHHTGWLS